MILELSNNTNHGFNSGCGISITNNEDRRDNIYINFHGEKGISGAVNVDGLATTARQFVFPLPIQKGAIRIRFGKDKKLMTLSASPTLSPGYQFRKVGSFTPTNTPPAGSSNVIKGDWKIGQTSRFAIQLTGFANNKQIAKDAITLDNFKVSGRP